MISNAISKDKAYLTTIEYIEKEYKLDIEEIYDNIKKAANNGKFYLRYYLEDNDAKIHSLVHYFKNMNFSCSNNYEFKKNETGRIEHDKNGNPIKDKVWFDIWWSFA